MDRENDGISWNLCAFVGTGKHFFRIYPQAEKLYKYRSLVKPSKNYTLALCASAVLTFISAGNEPSAVPAQAFGECCEVFD